MINGEREAFVELLGSSPRVKVINHLLENDQRDYTLTEIANTTGVGWATLHRMLPALLDLGLLKNTRSIGRAKLYTINKENTLVKALIEFGNRLENCLEQKEGVALRRLVLGLSAESPGKEG